MLTRIHICLADVRLTFASVSHMFLPMLNFRWPFESLQQAFTHTQHHHLIWMEVFQFLQFSVKIENSISE